MSTLFSKAKCIDDGEFFQALYEDYYGKIMGYLYKRVQNREEAEELTQDIFYRFYQRYQKGKVDLEKTEPYLYRSAQNALYDLWRKKGRNPKIMTMEPFEDIHHSFAQEEEKLDQILVDELLENLSDEEQTILDLRIIKGYSVKDTASVVNRPEGTIKSIQFRALEKLRRELVGGV